MSACVAVVKIYAIAQKITYEDFAYSLTGTNTLQLPFLYHVSILNFITQIPKKQPQWE